MRRTDIEALGELAGYALAGTGTLIRDMHEGIAGRPFEILGPAATPARVIHDGVSRAVYTGLRYRTPALANGVVKSRRPTRAMTGGAGPPGEPEPGASLVFPGDAADNTPAAREAVSGHARAEITGTGHGITSTVRIWARRWSRASS